VRGTGRSKRRALALALAIWLTAGSAAAHGPTVKIAGGVATPATLTVRRGTIVHFHAENALPGLVVPYPTEEVRSPALAAGEGWHHLFPVAGIFDCRVAGDDDVLVRVVVE